jgi:integrase
VATFIKVGTKTKALIRKQGYPTKSKTFIKQTDAQAWARKIESEMERGCFDDTSKLSTVSLSQLLDDYIANCKQRQLRATRFIQAHSRIIKRHIGDCSLKQLTSNRLTTYRDHRLKSVKPATVKHELGIIQRATIEGVERLGIGNYSFPKVRHPKVSNGRERRLRLGELEAIRGRISNEQVQAIIVLAVETGMRRGELLGIRHKHVDTSARTLSVPRTKTDRQRVVPLSTKALDTLRGPLSQTAEDELLFSIRPDSVTQAFSRACAAAGIHDLRFHDLRHEATSRFFERGFSMMEVALITGHQDPRMLRRYTHLDAAAMAKRLT